MLSPSLSRITKRMRSSITELSFHGIPLPPPSRGKSVTHVSGTFCYLCVEPDKLELIPINQRILVWRFCHARFPDVRDPLHSVLAVSFDRAHPLPHCVAPA